MFFEKKEIYSSLHDDETKEQRFIRRSGTVGTIGTALLVLFLLYLQESKHSPEEINQTMKEKGIPSLIDSTRVNKIIANDTASLNINSIQENISRIMDQKSSTSPLEIPE